ncbi:MAG: tyrosine-type recombinase/integrase [Ignavibacteriaceae bacterium]
MNVNESVHQFFRKHSFFLLLKGRIPAKIHQINDEYVFYKLSGVPYLPNYVSHNFKKALKKANVNQSLHMHSLRHGFASRLVQNGVSLYVVKELLGHADVSTTRQYSHLQKEHLQNAIDKLDKISKIG